MQTDEKLPASQRRALIEFGVRAVSLSFIFYSSPNRRAMILKDAGKLIVYFTKNSSEVNFLQGFSFFCYFLRQLWAGNPRIDFLSSLVARLHFFFRAVTVAARSRPDSRSGVN
jgi:hypothetical protein